MLLEQEPTIVAETSLSMVVNNVVLLNHRVWKTLLPDKGQQVFLSNITFCWFVNREQYCSNNITNNGCWQQLLLYIRTLFLIVIGQ